MKGCPEKFRQLEKGIIRGLAKIRVYEFGFNFSTLNRKMKLSEEIFKLLFGFYH